MSPYNTTGKKKKKLVQSLALALTLTLTLNYLANKPQQTTPAHCSYQVRDELLMNFNMAYRHVSIDVTAPAT